MNMTDWIKYSMVREYVHFKEHLILHEILLSSYETKMGNIIFFTSK